VLAVPAKRKVTAVAVIVIDDAESLYITHISPTAKPVLEFIVTPVVVSIYLPASAATTVVLVL
jgi:hypothetical protein